MSFMYIVTALISNHQINAFHQAIPVLNVKYLSETR